MKRDAETLDRLVSFIEAKLAPTGLDCCVLGTAIVVDVLKVAGIRAEPCSVRTTVLNRAAWRVYQETPPEQRDELPYGVLDDARVLALGYPEHLATVQQPAAPGGRWGGHLVALTDAFLLDPTVGQVNPSAEAWGIHVPPLVLRLRSGFREGDDAIAADLDPEWRVVYQTAPENRGWRACPDWRSAARWAVTAEFISAIRAGKCPGVTL